VTRPGSGEAFQVNWRLGRGEETPRQMIDSESDSRLSQGLRQICGRGKEPRTRRGKETRTRLEGVLEEEKRDSEDSERRRLRRGKEPQTKKETRTRKGLRDREKGDSDDSET
jgi:hypothetical protein